MPMKIYIAGVSCVGKTAVGMRLAARLNCPFYDLDKEIERSFGEPLAKLWAKTLTPYTFRKRFASVALREILRAEGNGSFVLALPPSGLMDSVYSVIRGTGVVVVLSDSPENILARITFYDDDSMPISKTLSDKERGHHLKEIREDVRYFARSFRKADMAVDIEGLGIEDSAAMVQKRLKDWLEAKC
jgi:shikimate kinase